MIESSLIPGEDVHNLQEYPYKKIETVMPRFLTSLSE